MKSLTRKWTAMLTVMMLMLIAAYPAAEAKAAEASQLVSKGNTTEKVIALTFDDGDDGGNIAALLQILSDNGVKATFFLTGKAVESHPQKIKDIIAKGHAIGNHSYSHPYFTQITAEQMKAEVEKADVLIRNLTGITTKPYFRPPYGAYNAGVLQAMGEAGYTKTVTWTIDTIDWEGRSAAEMTQKVLGNAVPGAIVLMHAGSGAVNTPAALPGIISGLKAAGYRFVTIPELLGSSSIAVQYVVKAGDTLYRIARLYGVTVQQIAAANNIANINLIYTGQVLQIPGTGGTTPPVTPTTPTTPSAETKYTVKAGDTLYRIAKLYGVTVQQLAAANKIANINLIFVGQVLTIPGTGGTVTPVTPVTPTPPAVTKYTVKAGDTLYKISLVYKVTVQQLVTSNKIVNPNLIFVGQVLIIP